MPHPGQLLAGFERLLAELGFELWIGDPAEINITTDREDARLLPGLLREDRFRGSGCRVQRIATCSNCYGIAIGLYYLQHI